jgi:hypothetical protein
MGARRSRRPRRIDVPIPDTPMKLASLMCSVVVRDATEIVVQLELILEKSRDHRVRDELLFALHDAIALRDYADVCIERLFAQLQGGGRG